MVQALPPVSPFLTAFTAFCTRANLRAARHDIDGARSDLLTALRLSRLLQQNPSLLVRLVATAGETQACRTARTIVLHAGLTAEQLHTLAASFAALPPPPTLSGTFDIGERFTTLDSLTHLAVGDSDTFLRLELLIFDKDVPIDTGDLNQVDWNVVLSSANNNFDQSVKTFDTNDWRAVRKSIHAQQASSTSDDIPSFPASSMFSDKAAKGISDYQAMWSKQRDLVLAFMHKRPDESSEAFTQRIEKLFLQSDDVDAHVVNTLASRSVEFTLTQTTLALAMYHADNSAYPDTLQQLIPAYLPYLPDDPFSTAPLVYHHIPTGFTLYSIGPNEIDDHGQSNPDDKTDDIVATIELHAN